MSLSGVSCSFDVSDSETGAAFAFDASWAVSDAGVDSIVEIVSLPLAVTTEFGFT